MNSKNRDYDKIKSWLFIEEIRNIIKNNVKLKKINLDIKICTGNILLTSYVVAIISTIMSSIIPVYVEGSLEGNSFLVMPIYEDKLQYKIKINSIITIKMVHIIHTIYLKKRRDKEYVRKSNRKSYASSYE